MRGRGARLVNQAWAVERRWPGFWKALGLSAAGAFAVWQYFAVQTSATVERTMEYIKRYEEGEVAEARRNLSAKLRPFIPQFNKFRNVSPSGRKRVVDTLFDADPEIIDDVDTIVDFFGGLRTCVEEEICSRRVAIGYFGGSESQQFWSNFRPYFDERRQNNPEFANGVEWFVRQGGGQMQ